MKNTSVFLSLVLACCVAGCSQPAGPQRATKVMLEDEVKVHVDPTGHSSTGAPAKVASPDAAPKP